MEGSCITVIKVQGHGTRLRDLNCLICCFVALGRLLITHVLVSSSIEIY